MICDCFFPTNKGFFMKKVELYKLFDSTEVSHDIVNEKEIFYLKDSSKIQPTQI
jgi:hypothetical protein